MPVNPAIEEFMSDVKAILAERGETGEGFERISERMRELITTPGATDGLEPPSGNVHTRQQAIPLYSDEDGLTLALARFDPEAMTPIHSHGSWGVIGVYEGHDLYQVWRRLDSGEGPGEARVEIVEERVLGPGDVVTLPPPPQDIHAQQGYGGETALEFVLFGRNVMNLPRLYFDPERGRAREVAVSAQAERRSG